MTHNMRMIGCVKERLESINIWPSINEAGICTQLQRAHQMLACVFCFSYNQIAGWVHIYDKLVAIIENLADWINNFSTVKSW